MDVVGNRIFECRTFACTSRLRRVENTATANGLVGRARTHYRRRPSFTIRKCTMWKKKRINKSTNKQMWVFPFFHGSTLRCRQTKTDVRPRSCLTVEITLGDPIRAEQDLDFDVLRVFIRRWPCACATAWLYGRESVTTLCPSERESRHLFCIFLTILDILGLFLTFHENCSGNFRKFRSVFEYLRNAILKF